MTKVLIPENKPYSFETIIVTRRLAPMAIVMLPTDARAPKASAIHHYSYLYGCPCGYFQDSTRECTCSPGLIARFQKRISGPLLDRIDIHVEAPRVDYEKLTDRNEAERSADVRARVRAARLIQARCFASAPRMTCNAEMGPAEVLLRAAMQRLQLSARAFHRVLKLARTIADLAGAETIAAPQLAEALQYRPRVDGG
jgi:magnesium chelatase family protein